MEAVVPITFKKGAAGTALKGVVTSVAAETDPDTRWIMSEFFKQSWTKYPTLTELNNGRNKNTDGITDTTDIGLAQEILNRAGLADSFRYNDICQGLAGLLSLIDDPLLFMNPIINSHDPGPIDSPVEVTSFTPRTGKLETDEITVTGKGFKEGIRSKPKLYLSNTLQEMNFSVVSDTQIKFKPAGVAAGNHTIKVVTTLGQASSKTKLVVEAKPSGE